MSSVRVLNNIEPFNNIFYKLCFNSSFFPVAYFLNKNEMPILINDVTAYSYDKDGWSGFSVDYIAHKHFLDLLENERIKYENRNTDESLTENVCGSIDRGRPVILWVDCFFDPLRRDTYLKKHLPHTILVYGYNKEEKLFNVIEHKYRYSLSYTKSVIKFSDLNNCYEGQEVNLGKCGIPKYEGCNKECGYQHSSDYKKKCGFLRLANLESREAFNGYYEFYNDTNEQMPSKREITNLELYSNNLLNNRERIIKGIDSFNNFVKQINALVSDEDELFRSSQSLLDIFNEIINAKLAERYKILRIEGFNIEFVAALDEMIGLLNFIRNILTKYIYSSVYNKDKFNEMIEGLENVFQYESRYYDILFASLQKQ